MSWQIKSLGFVKPLWNDHSNPKSINTKSVRCHKSVKAFASAQSMWLTLNISYWVTTITAYHWLKYGLRDYSMYTEAKNGVELRGSFDEWHAVRWTNKYCLQSRNQKYFYKFTTQAKVELKEVL